MHVWFARTQDKKKKRKKNSNGVVSVRMLRARLRERGSLKRGEKKGSVTRNTSETAIVIITEEEKKKLRT